MKSIADHLRVVLVASGGGGVALACLHSLAPPSPLSAECGRVSSSAMTKAKHFFFTACPLYLWLPLYTAAASNLGDHQQILCFHHLLPATFV